MGNGFDSKDLRTGLSEANRVSQFIRDVGALDGELRREGAVWIISLDNRQTHALSGVLASGGGTLAAASGPLWPVIGGVLASAAGWIETVNFLGGENGVDINGVLGARGVIVTPRLGGLFEPLAKAARIEASGMAVLEYLVYASSEVPTLGALLGLPVVASVFKAVSSGTPLGWAIAGAVGLVVRLLDPEPDPNAHGAVMADRDEAREWESFYLGSIGEGDKVSLLSWQGFFSAQMGGGHGVYANRPKIGDWEKWTLLRNGDGTVSLRTFDGHYLCAEEGGGRECQANRSSIGNWEKFHLLNLPGGKVALRTLDRGKLVSVQQNS